MLRWQSADWMGCGCCLLQHLHVALWRASTNNACLHPCLLYNIRISFQENLNIVWKEHLPQPQSFNPVVNYLTANVNMLLLISMLFMPHLFSLVAPVCQVVMDRISSSLLCLERLNSSHPATLQPNFPLLLPTCLHSSCCSFELFVSFYCNLSVPTPCIINRAALSIPVLSVSVLHQKLALQPPAVNVDSLWIGFPGLLWQIRTLHPGSCWAAEITMTQLS